jgi:hypothetical protein
MENKKKCKSCSIEFPLFEYHKHKISKDGHANDCKSCAINRSKKYHQQNKELIAIKSKKYRLENREYFNRKTKEWGDKTGYFKKYQNSRLENDSLFKFKNRLRTLIRLSITKQGYSKNTKTFEILGCSYNGIIIHIESKFKKGMSWDNHGTWHIDHIIPMSNAKNIDDAIKLNHYKNLQPLWAKENIIKSNKINNETYEQ